MTSAFDSRVDAIAQRVGLDPNRKPEPRRFNENERAFIDAVQERFPGAAVYSQVPEPPATLVRVTTPHVVAGFILREGVVRQCAPSIAKHFLGKLDHQARAVIRANNWTAAIIPDCDNSREALGLEVERGNEEKGRPDVGA